mgnify:FL=1
MSTVGKEEVHRGYILKTVNQSHNQYSFNALNRIINYLICNNYLQTKVVTGTKQAISELISIQKPLDDQPIRLKNSQGQLIGLKVPKAVPVASIATATATATATPKVKKASLWQDETIMDLIKLANQ